MAKQADPAKPAGGEIAVPAKPPAILSTLREDTVLAPNKVREAVNDKRFMDVLMQSAPAVMRASVSRLGAALVVEMNRNEYLAGATALSLMGGLVQATTLGLELGGTLGQAYLVPYRNKGRLEAQFQVGYRGLITLASRSPVAKIFDAFPVYDNDVFDVQYGTDPRVLHKPAVRGPRGDLVGCYAWFENAAGGRSIEFMSVEEIEEHAKKYSKSYGNSSSPWKTAFVEMARKTPLRRLGKRVPVSVEMTHASVLDEYGEEGIDQQLRVVARAALDGELPEMAHATAERVGEMIGAEQKE